MLPRDERLPTAQFARTWEHGVLLRHALLSVRATPGETSEGPARCAFVVPRKSGKATARNRIRRRVRECYRLCEARKNGALRGHNVIFLINASRAEAPATEWTQAFEELAPRIARDVRRAGERRLGEWGVREQGAGERSVAERQAGGQTRNDGQSTNDGKTAGGAE